MERRYNTHWHLRVTEPAEGFLEHIINNLDKHLDTKIAYYCIGESVNPNERGHIHAAIGTTTSIKKVTLQRLLELLPKNNNYLNYDLKGTKDYGDKMPKAMRDINIRKSVLTPLYDRRVCEFDSTT